MDLITLNRDYTEKDTIDVFDSAIWTERFYGDGDFSLDVPATSDFMAALPKGQLITCEGSSQPMILETREIKDEVMKTTGIGLTQWLNNRLARASSGQTVKTLTLGGPLVPGAALAQLISWFAMPSNYNNGTFPNGMPTSQTTKWPIPGLSLGSIDSSGSAVDFGTLDAGPLYDLLRTIATRYAIGMRIDLVATALKFVAWKGVDRSSDQTTNPVIRFSPEMDTLTSIRDLESITDYKTEVYTFAPGLPTGPLNSEPPGSVIDTTKTGFDIRVLQVYNDTIQSDYSGSAADLANTLNQQAAFEAFNHRAVQLVDGEIVQTGQIEYGVDYYLGDYVEVEGNTGVLQKTQITEYIRSQDATGERAYPGLSSSG